jgi:hypothetical protein
MRFVGMIQGNVIVIFSAICSSVLHFYVDHVGYRHAYEMMRAMHSYGMLLQKWDKRESEGVLFECLVALYTFFMILKFNLQCRWKMDF